MLAAALLTMLYVLLIPTTALAWTWLLRAMYQPARYRRMLPIMAITQFGKYLPGNVAQHIGRIALARTAGVSLPAALFSVAYEMLLMLVACAHISALTLLWAPPATLSHWRITGYRVPLLIVITLGAIVGLLLAPRMASWLARYRANRRGDQDHVPPQVALERANGTRLLCRLCGQLLPDRQWSMVSRACLTGRYRSDTKCSLHDRSLRRQLDSGLRRARRAGRTGYP